MDAGQRADVLAMWQVVSEPLVPQMASTGGKGPAQTPLSVLRQAARAPMALSDLLNGWVLKASAGKPQKPAGPPGLSPFVKAQLAKGVPLEKIMRAVGG